MSQLIRFRVRSVACLVVLLPMLQGQGDAPKDSSCSETSLELVPPGVSAPIDSAIIEELACWIDLPIEAGLLTASVTGGTPPYAVEAWTTSDGWIIEGYEVDGTLLFISYDVLPTGCGQPFDVNVVVTDVDGIQTSCSEVILPPPGDCTVEPAFQEICSGEQAVFCARAFLTPPVTYYWVGPNGFSAEGECIEVTEPGEYEVLGIDPFGCESVPCKVDLSLRICPDCGPEFWSRHAELWDAEDDDDVTEVVKTTVRFNEFFAVTRKESRLEDDVTLRDATNLQGNGRRALAAHATAAAVNADSIIDFPLTLEEVWDVYREAVMGDAKGKGVQSALSILSDANEWECSSVE